MEQFYCQFLNSNVELTNERWEHIKQRHPDVELFISNIKDVLLKPDLIRKKNDVLLFSQFLKKIKKHLVVVVKSSLERNFVLTCYLTSKIKGGEVLWMKEI